MPEHNPDGATRHTVIPDDPKRVLVNPRGADLHAFARKMDAAHPKTLGEVFALLQECLEPETEEETK